MNDAIHGVILTVADKIALCVTNNIQLKRFTVKGGHITGWAAITTTTKRVIDRLRHKHHYGALKDGEYNLSIELTCDIREDLFNHSPATGRYYGAYDCAVLLDRRMEDGEWGWMG
jgi:hypothetical protein